MGKGGKVFLENKGGGWFGVRVKGLLGRGGGGWLKGFWLRVKRRGRDGNIGGRKGRKVFFGGLSVEGVFRVLAFTRGGR